MKQTIEIEVPEGKKAIWEDGKIIFENIQPKLPKTWEEFCNNYPIKKGEVFIDDTSIITLCDTNNRYKCISQNVLPNAEAAMNHLTLMKLHQLRDCYRQGWIPNWCSSLQEKYCIWHFNGSYAVDCSETAPFFLAFQSEEIAEEFLNNFRDLIEQAVDLI